MAISTLAAGFLVMGDQVCSDCPLTCLACNWCADAIMADRFYFFDSSLVGSAEVLHCPMCGGIDLEVVANEPLIVE